MLNLASHFTEYEFTFLINNTFCYRIKFKKYNNILKLLVRHVATIEIIGAATPHHATPLSTPMDLNAITKDDKEVFEKASKRIRYDSLTKVVGEMKKKWILMITRQFQLRKTYLR